MAINKTIYRVLVYVIIVLVAIIDIAVNLSLKKISIFPSANNIIYETYNEDAADVNGTTSKVSFDYKENDFLQIKYTMLGDPHSMYAGISFSPKESQHFNIKDVNQIKLKLKSNYGKRIPIYIICEYTVVKNNKQTLLDRPFEAFIDYSKNQSSYEINLDDFVTPNWWFAENGISRADIEGIKLDKINSINIENCKIIKAGIEDVIQIKEFVLQADNTPLYIRVALILILGFAFSTFFFTIIRKKKLHVAYQPTEIPTKKVEEPITQISDYFAANYMETDLSLEKASKDLGISKQDISKQIKTNLGLSFKQYLNGFRMAEVKRLLHESELSVSEIAYQAGYNNISHFNRIFKTETGLSPKEFRGNNN